jgi:hypothetical protein
MLLPIPFLHIAARTNKQGGLQVSPAAPPFRLSAFTLVEMFVTVAIFSAVVVVMMTAQSFGVKMLGITAAKIRNNAESRKLGGRLLVEIREAKTVKIGFGNERSFIEVNPNETQQGNSIEVCATTNRANFVRYFLDAKGNLKRLDSQSGNVAVIATEVAQSSLFALEDFNGRVLTNTQNSMVVRIDLQFQKTIDSFRDAGGFRKETIPFRTRVARRMIE